MDSKGSGKNYKYADEVEFRLKDGSMQLGVILMIDVDPEGSQEFDIFAPYGESPTVYKHIKKSDIVSFIKESGKR